MSENHKTATATDPRPGYDVESSVRDRYAQGAQQVQPALCCPITEYEGQYLKNLPAEIIEKDYGCGDPSRYVGEGETVVDLGSGAGKACYIMSQKVGPGGRVIGVDFNDAMLDLARKYQKPLAETFGFANVEFRKGRIQDLALDLDRVQQWLDENPVSSIEQMAAYESHCAQLRDNQPMIETGSVDVVVSNCVLNLVKPEDKGQLFSELFRVLKRGGRAVISDIVCDELPTEAIMQDADLWSGCIAGAYREDHFLEAFEEAGFHGIEILARHDEPWQVIDGIEFYSVTVQAFKGKQGPCLERNQAVMYKGPWKQVRDDDGHTYPRGKRMAVCDKTYKLLTGPNSPYASSIIGIEPKAEVPLEGAEAFACTGMQVRDPRVTKGADYRETRGVAGSCCGPDEQAGAGESCCEPDTPGDATPSADACCPPGEGASGRCC